jgi:cold shock CspA family protein/ribosome-associated translation inhibitor RaiA
MEIHWVSPEAFRAEQRSGVEERIAQLTRDRTDVIDVRIAARESGHHRHGGQEVRITCEARGKEIVVARTCPDADLALDEAIEVFEREVWRMRDRRAPQRGERERPQGPPELGVVDEIVKGEGYGFILTDGGERVYFHRNALHGGLAFEGLEEGQRVGLDFEGGLKGLQATFVRPPPPDAPSR